MPGVAGDSSATRASTATSVCELAALGMDWLAAAKYVEERVEEWKDVREVEPSPPRGDRSRSCGPTNVDDFLDLSFSLK